MTPQAILAPLFPEGSVINKRPEFLRAVGMGHRDLGSGKSTVRRCLAERGVRAHVVDGDEFREWREKETNEPIVEPSNWHEPDRVDGPEDARVPMSSELRDVQRRLSPSEVAALIAVYEAGGWVGSWPSSMDRPHHGLCPWRSDPKTCGQTDSFRGRGRSALLRRCRRGDLGPVWTERSSDGASRLS
jgi:hypothetical protein